MSFIPNERVMFEYNGRTYSGYIVSSNDIQPHFYWFLFEDQELISKISDSIAFMSVDGKLKPVHTYTTHRELVHEVQKAVEKYLAVRATRE